MKMNRRSSLASGLAPGGAEAKPAQALAAVLPVFLRRRLLPALRRRWTSDGVLLALCWAGVAATGLVRVMKNRPDAFFAPTFVMFVDWSHLGFVMPMGLVSLGRSVTSRKGAI